jgi:uncharacterized membrane protein (DUF2068 family)
VSLMVLVTVHHHPWVKFACIGVELIVVVYMLREVVAMKREGSGVKLRLEAQYHGDVDGD